MRTPLDLLRALGRRVFPARRTAEPGQLAFWSLASDPALLRRLPRDQARRLGAQAECFATALLKDDARGAAGAAPRDAASQVIGSARRFAARDAVVGTGADEMVASVLTGATDGLGGLLAALADEVRRPSGAPASLAMEALVALGAAGLQRLGRDPAELLMTAASRHAAGCLRDGSGDWVEAGLAIVETVCARWGTLPLPASPRGTRRDWAEQLVELWRDAAACAGRPGAGPARRLWEDARDAHAFGAVWMMPSILPALVRTEAESLARDARSAASYVLRRGSVRPGVRAAIEAARAVLVSCEAARAVMVSFAAAPDGEVAVTPPDRFRASATPVHAVPA